MNETKKWHKFRFMVDSHWGLRMGYTGGIWSLISNLALMVFIPLLFIDGRLPIMSLLVFFGALLIGAFSGITIFRKLPHIPTFLGLTGLFTISSVIIIIFMDPILLYIGLGCLGLGEGAVYGRAYFLGHTSLDSERAIENSGQNLAFYYFLFNGMLVIPCLLIGIFGLSNLNAIFPVAAYGIILFLLIPMRTFTDLPKQQALSLSQFIFGKKYQISKFFYFFCGLIRLPFFFGVILLLTAIETPPITTTTFYEFILIGLAADLILGIPLGRLIDRLGRKYGVLIGILCYIFCVFVIISLNITYIGILIFAGVLLGIGAHCTSNIIPVYIEEIAERDTYFDLRNAEAVLVYIGAFVGVAILVGFYELWKNIPQDIFAFFLIAGLGMMFLLFSLRETLPVADEVAWRKAVQFLYVLDKSGICIYDKNLAELTLRQRTPDESLLGGYVVAMDALLKEIAQDEKPVEIVKKEGFSIMMEEGKTVIVALITLSELKILREKLRGFTEEFEFMFSDLLAYRQIADITVFRSAKMLVQKYFAL